MRSVSRLLDTMRCGLVDRYHRQIWSSGDSHLLECWRCVDGRRVIDVSKDGYAFIFRVYRSKETSRAEIFGQEHSIASHKSGSFRYQSFGESYFVRFEERIRRPRTWETPVSNCTSHVYVTSGACHLICCINTRILRNLLSASSQQQGPPGTSAPVCLTTRRHITADIFIVKAVRAWSTSRGRRFYIAGPLRDCYSDAILVPPMHIIQCLYVTTLTALQKIFECCYVKTLNIVHWMEKCWKEVHKCHVQRLSRLFKATSSGRGWFKERETSPELPIWHRSYSDPPGHGVQSLATEPLAIAAATAHTLSPALPVELKSLCSGIYGCFLLIWTGF
jgi:hypothetical protein